MLIKILRWLEPPKFEGNEELTDQTRIANTLILYLGAALLVVIFIFIPLFAFQKIGSWVLSIIMFCTLVIGRRLIFKGRFQLGGTLIFSIIYLCILAMLILSGGSSGTAMFYFATVVLIAGFFLDARVVNGLTVATFLIGMGISFLEEQGWVTIPKVFIFNSVFSWVATGIGLLFMIRTRDLFVGNLKNAVTTAQQKNVEIQEVEARFRAVVEHSNNGVVFMSAERKINYASPAYQQFLGFTPEEMFGHFGAEYIQPEDRELTAQTFRELLQTPGGTAILEYRLQRKDGSYCWVETTAANLLDNPNVQSIVLNQRDITERKQAEESLRKSEAKFRAVVENSNDGILFGDVNANILYRSPSYNQINGYSDEERIGHSGFETVHPDDADNLHRYWARMVAQPEMSHRTEYRIRHKDGSWRWIETSAQNLSGNPNVHSVVVTSRDITSRKQVEGALRESEARAQAMFQAIPDLMFRLNRQGVYLDYKADVNDLFVQSKSGIVGKHHRDLTTPKFADLIDKYIQITLETKTLQTFEYQLPIPDMGERYYEARMAVSGKDEVTMIVRDITERKQADEALRESGEKFKTLFNTANDAIFTMNHTTFLDCNAVTEKIFKCSRENIIGHSPVEFSPERQPDGSLSSQSAIRKIEAAFEGQPQFFEWLHCHLDGTPFYAEVSLNRVFIGGEFILQAIVRDINERKQAEEQIRQSEKKYRELFQNNKDGIAIFPLNPNGAPGPFMEVNDAAPQMLGYTREEMLKLTPMMLEPHTTPEELQWRQSEFASKGVANFETVLLHKNGQPVFTEFSAQMIQYEDQPAIMNIVRDITERKQHEKELSAIAALSLALRSASTRAEMLPVIIEQLRNLLNCDTISIEIIDPITNESVVEAAYGTWTSLIGFRQPPGTGMNAIISETRRPHHNNNIKGRSRIGISKYSMEHIVASAGVPLIAQDQVIGFLWMGHSKEIAENEVRLLAAITDIAANAIHRATLHEQTQKDAANLKRAYDTTLEGWAHALELRDHETEGHTRRVAQLTLDLALAMGVGESELENIRRGALLHDIGKMGIPDSILLKTGELNEGEWEIMRQHPEYSYKLLEPIEYLRPVLDIPHCHHEKWDGSGYPRGLKGEEIPLAARIFAIVDVWDALTSDRPYRLAWSKEKALAHIMEQSSKHFDPAVVEAFLKII